jgi:hypothetical protein
MNRSTKTTFSLFAALCCAAASAQTETASTQVTSISDVLPTQVAFLYVESVPIQSTTNEVTGFAVAADGHLSFVPGSPFNYAVDPEGANGKYLFGMESNGHTIDSFLMEPNGALQKVDSINTATFNPGANSCSFIGQFKVDHSGKDLYNSILDPACSFQETFPTRLQEFQINNSNGKLSYIGETAENDGGSDDIAFLGNNQFGFAKNDFDFDSNFSCGIERYRRSSNGTLSDLGESALGPNGVLGPFPQNSQDFYCPVMFATDATDHMAAVFFGSGNEPWVIGTYTANANGNLSTTSTYQNMPVINPGSELYSMRMSPSGKLLAVGSANGLEVFHFNGGSPVTGYKKLLANEKVIQVLWDNNDHLFALVSSTSPFGALHEYTVTPTSFTEVAGSPVAVNKPKAMAIQPK